VRCCKGIASAADDIPSLRRPLRWRAQGRRAKHRHGCACGPSRCCSITVGVDPDDLPDELPQPRRAKARSGLSSAMSSSPGARDGKKTGSTETSPRGLPANTVTNRAASEAVARRLGGLAMTPLLSLADAELAQLIATAALLPVEKRAASVQRVATALKAAKAIAVREIPPT
jgi:hypothetical protein